MEKVEGIGGLFLGARDPGGLATRCADRLGGVWAQQAGPTEFARFRPETRPHDTEGNAVQMWEPA